MKRNEVSGVSHYKEETEIQMQANVVYGVGKVKDAETYSAPDDFYETPSAPDDLYEDINSYEYMSSLAANH